MSRLYLIALIAFAAALAIGAVFWFLRRSKTGSHGDEKPFTGNVDSRANFHTRGAARFQDRLWEHEARELARAGRKIEAIKLVRERTGLGLKEAKEMVERL